MRYILKPGASHDPLWYNPHMWTPLLLICYIDRPDCAMPAAPAYFTEAECRLALDYAVEAFALPANMTIVAHDCFNWGSGT